ncbi:hypothetical protein KF840_19065 [bacterium]|nr:hypothetical protein [bacterium]
MRRATWSGLDGRAVARGRRARPGESVEATTALAEQPPEAEAPTPPAPPVSESTSSSTD